MNFSEQIAIYAQAAAILVSVAVAFFTIRTGWRWNKRMKSIDVIMHCNERYVSLSENKPKMEESWGDGKLSDVAISYYRKYWGLKSDQFDYWAAGYVDHDTFTSWFYSVAEFFSRPLSSDEIDKDFDLYRQCWATVGVDINDEINEIFVNFIDKIEEEFPRLKKDDYEKRGRHFFKKLSRMIQSLSEVGDFAIFSSHGPVRRYKPIFDLDVSYRKYLKIKNEVDSIF